MFFYHKNQIQLSPMLTSTVVPTY